MATFTPNVALIRFMACEKILKISNDSAIQMFMRKELQSLPTDQKT